MPTSSFDQQSEGLSDRERLIRLEAVVRGLQVHFEDARATDKTLWDERYRNLAAQMLTVATAHERMAQISSVEKNEAHIQALEKTVQSLVISDVPRSEIEAKFEGMATRMSSMSNDMARLDQALLKLTTILQEDDTQNKVSLERATATRSKYFGYVASFCAVAGLCVSLILGLRSHDGTSPPTTTTTVSTTTTTLIPGR
jgi:vacuolar-type H+-ATPase subunit I/STV1